ncbi:MAG: hypothetical protein ACSHWQ_04965 [Spongiibacteraceae bacterium]
MSALKKEIQDLLDELKTQRDLLSLKIHLAKAEVGDEWQELEGKYEHFKVQSKRVSDDLRDTADALTDDLKELGDDLREGYNRVKQSLK